MNDEISIRKLTPELIEACMDRDIAEIIGRSEKEILAGDVWAEIELFDTLMTSEKIRGELFGIISALYDDQATVITDLSVLRERFRELLLSGKVTDHQVELVTQTCRTFLFLGWHARGAVEGVDQLKSLAE